MRNSGKIVINIFLLVSMILLAIVDAVAQLPSNVDPGNARDTTLTEDQYLWSNPNIYIPVLLVVILIIGYSFIKKRKLPKK